MFRFYLCFWVQVYYEFANSTFVILRNLDKLHKIEYTPRAILYK